MKNLFEIDSSEIKRILNLHEERTKTQYLDIVSEQDTSFTIPSYTTTKSNGLRQADKSTAFLFLPQNTKFEATKDSKIVTAKNVNITNKEGGIQKENVRVSFYCQQGKFFIQNDTNGYLSEVLAKALVSNVCGKINYKTKVLKEYLAKRKEIKQYLLQPGDV